jgi:DNA adenine methylase
VTKAVIKWRKWIVSYDSAPEILGHYAKRKSFTYELQYNAAKAYKGSELFIFSDKLKVPKTSTTPFIARGLQSAQS